MTAPAIPEHLKKYADQKTTDSQSLADSGNPTIPRLSIKGGKFRYIFGEDESKKFNSVDVVIVGVDPEGGRMNKTFYLGAFDPANPEPPDCSSINGVVPDSWVAEPQASRCAGCPKNAFGSAVNAQGQRTKGKACKDSKWLWVIKLEDMAKEDPRIWCLNVPASSLKGLSAFGRQISKTGLPLHVIHARLEMDDEFDYPVIEFQLAGYLDEPQSEASSEIHADQPWRDLVGDTGVPLGALTQQKAEQQLIESKPEAISDEHDTPPPAKKAAKKKASEPEATPETSNPDSAVEDW